MNETVNTHGEVIVQPELIQQALGSSTVETQVTVDPVAEHVERRYFRDHTNPYTLKLPDGWFRRSVLRPRS
jgi:hypothetical protein